MGIRGLNKIITQHAKKSLSQHKISKFCGSKIAIDSEILIYRYVAKDHGKSKNSHIHGFINNIFWHLRNGITPIYVFDGIPTAAKKKNALSKRYTQKERLYQKVEDLESKFVEQLENIDDYTTDAASNALSPEMNETLDELLKLQRRLDSMNVTKNHKHECRYLLKLMGVPFINAAEDAEALCVALQAEKKVDYVYTEDTDALTYAAGFLAAGYDFVPKIMKKGTDLDSVSVVDLNVILQEFEMTPDSFIDMCIMSGCDFCTSIPRIGPMKSYTYMKKYKDIDTFLKETDTETPEGFEYQNARDIFKKNHAQELTKSLELGKLNTEDLKTYLIQERSLNPLPIIARYEAQVKVFKSKVNQQSLNSWFKPV